MQGDLISRSELIKAFAENTPYGCGTIGIKFVDDLIKAQPTAYDVEKVVAELEEEKEWYSTHGSNKDLNKGIIGATNTAIRIITEETKAYNNELAKGDNYKAIEGLDDVIERLQYKADNIKAKLEPSYFTECIDYLKTLNSNEHYSETDELDGYGYGCSNKTCVARVRNRVIDDFAEKLSTDVESFEYTVNGIRANLMTEDYFHEYIWEIAEQMKEG